MRIYELLINKLSNSIISDTISIQHKYKSDYRHDIILYKSQIQYKPVLQIKESNSVNRTSQHYSKENAINI